MVDCLVTYFVNFLSLFLIWWPWISFFSDSWFLQFSILYTFYLFLNSKNLYYILLYLFIEVFYFGLFISIYQMELFTGFLWVTECTVIFISLLLLFYLNSKGNFYKLDLNFYKYNYIFFINIIIFFFYSFSGDLENFNYLNLSIIELWDNYYEAYFNTNTNDFMGLLLSYYFFNCFEFFLLGFILLIGSVICVNLFKLNNIIKLQKYDNLFTLFDFFKDSVSFFFLRKQNILNQQIVYPSTRIFKKEYKNKK
uniref:ymf62 n=1 Tax=Cryptocaryon irritans TaxID=153251 RepID=UPI0022FD3F37|nr:ymf62 [Cryptocaryon irritans]WBP62327.1 ymf62 [Cryptocaryon irritans]